ALLRAGATVATPAEDERPRLAQRFDRRDRGIGPAGDAQHNDAHEKSPPSTHLGPGRMMGGARERGQVSRVDVLEIARAHLGGRPYVFLAPQIPAQKLDGARRTHEVHLSPDETIVLLYDDTIFGSGTEGFFCTHDALYWRYVFDHPRRIAWNELEPESVVAT